MRKKWSEGENKHDPDEIMEWNRHFLQNPYLKWDKKIQTLKLRKCENWCDKERKNSETEKMKIAES